MPPQEPIHLSTYDPNWPIKFETEKPVIQWTLGDWIVGGIEHVGSTAVPELIAKSVVDIMVGVKNLAEAGACIPLLKKIGYVYSPYRTEIMHWFCKPSFAQRDFHLYLMEPSTIEWEKRIGFRNYLRNHPEVAEKYVALKKELAKKFPKDREAYTDNKAEFIEKYSLI